MHGRMRLKEQKPLDAEDPNEKQTLLRREEGEGKEKKKKLDFMSFPSIDIFDKNVERRPRLSQFLHGIGLNDVHQPFVDSAAKK